MKAAAVDARARSRGPRPREARPPASVVVLRGSIGLIAYTYLVFPLLTVLRGLLRPRPYDAADIAPALTVIIAAHNEVDVIADKLDNLLGLDYPAERIEVLVVSDGSDDGTEERVREYDDPRVRLLSLSRVGKMRALNAAVEHAEGEILVFSDANGMYDRGALRALVRPFADRAVGGVAGDQRYTGTGGNEHEAPRGEQRYWDFDRILKVSGSRAGNTISATGAIYAIRRELYEPIPVGVTDDFFVSTAVIAQGRRLVFEADAKAYEPVADSDVAEYARKVRVISQGFRSVAARRRLLDPRRYGFYSVQLFSHKVLRRVMAVPLIAIGLVTPALCRRRRSYRALALGQLGFYGLAAIGHRLPGHSVGTIGSLIRLPAYFCMVNIAALQGLWNFLRGRRIDRWDPYRMP